MINAAIIKSCLGLEIEPSIYFERLGLSNSKESGTLSFIDSEKFLEQINNNENIRGVFCSEGFEEKVTGKIKIVVDDARFAFYTLFNEVAKQSKNEFESEINSRAIVSERAYISKQNVRIGAGTIISPNVTILPDVEIGENCIIQAGTVIGSEGFEYKQTTKGILPVLHDGKVIIGNNVQIGANTCIDKGFSFRNTIIGDSVMIDNLVHVAHGVTIMDRAFIIAGTILGGSCVIEEDAWLSINTSIAPSINIKRKGFVSIGAVVTKNVEEGQQVTGNFALDHNKFIELLKQNLKK